MPHLMWLFAVPFFASVLVSILPGLSGKNRKYLAVGMSLIPLIMLLYGNRGWLGDRIEYPWIPALTIAFHLSIDSLSLIFLFLISTLIPISLLSGRSKDLSNPRIFYGLVLFLQGLLIGFFTVRDLVLFTVFWEAMLLPLYFILSIWGGKDRQNAALKFLVYMIAGSALMVAAVLFLYISAESSSGTGSFNLDVLAKISESTPHASWLCAIFLLAFAVKTPLFPFHAWLPDAYCQAPTSGSILLAGILSKAGIYGILRIGMELFPTVMKEWSPLLLGLAIAGVFYGAFAAWMQTDFKRLIAYSSLSHVNFILAGLFVWSQTSYEGAILQAVNHGITITALFLVAGWLEERLGSTSMTQASGLAKYLPKLCWLTLFFVLSSVALPGTNNFVGEIMIFFGLFGKNPWLAFILAFTVIFSVVYMLRWMQMVYFNAASSFKSAWEDIKGREIVVALPLVLLILWIGIYPTPLLREIDSTVKIIGQETLLLTKQNESMQEFFQ